MRVVIAEDLFLLRDGLIRHAAGPRLRDRRGGRQRRRLLAALTSEQAGRGHRRRPAAADVHRRGDAGRAGGPARGARACRCSCCPSTSSSCTPASCWPTAAAGSATCSRTGCSTVRQFVDAVRRVAAGGTAMDPEVIARLLARSAGDGRLAALTPREREVLALMAEGRSNAAIAQRLVITERAVAKHTTTIFIKLGPAALRRRQPAGARRPRLPGRLTTTDSDGGRPGRPSRAGLDVMIRRGRTGRGSSPCPTPRRSRSRTSPSRHRSRRPPRARAARSSSRR